MAIQRGETIRNVQLSNPLAYTGSRTTTDDSRTMTLHDNPMSRVCDPYNSTTPGDAPATANDVTIRSELRGPIAMGSEADQMVRRLKIAWITDAL